MKRAWLSVALPSLLGIMLITSSCNTDSLTGSAVQTCLGTVGMDVVQSWVSGESASISDAIQILVSCIPAAVAVFGAPASDSSPMVDINHNGDDQTFAAQFNSQVLDNCNSAYPAYGTYYFDVPWKMVIGPSSGVQSTFTANQLPTSGSDNASLIANQLYQQDNTSQYLTSGGGHSGAVRNVTVPAGAQLQLHIPVLMHYHSGMARVSSNGNVQDTEPWYYYTHVEQHSYDQVTETTLSC